MPFANTASGAFALALIPIVAPSAEQPGVWQMHEEQVLGAPANFVVTARHDEEAMAAVSAARAEIERLDAVFNARRTTSELSRLNRASVQQVSAELFDVLRQAEALRAASGGAFDGRLGAALRLWRVAADAPPNAMRLREAARAASAEIGLASDSPRVTRPPGVQFDLDGLAKGYIVDRALAAGLAAGPVTGMLIDIGGDMRCSGVPPVGLTWDVGIPDPNAPGDRAPLVARAHLRDQAIATSGRGPRDRAVGGTVYSATLSPGTGWASEANLGATVVAKTAAQADGLATALLVMPPQAGMALIERTPGAEARLTGSDGAVHRSTGWRRTASEPPSFRRIALAAEPRARKPAARPDPTRWNADWAVEVTYSAPDRAVGRRQADFRSPYMAMWITDAQNRPIRTLVLVGVIPQWQRDNFIWWGMYKDRAAHLVELRSTATQLDGSYPTYWPGYDDDWKFVPKGDYVLHIETSRERGQHTYRTVKLRLGDAGFSTVVPKTEEGGGLSLAYGKRD